MSASGGMCVSVLPEYFMCTMCLLAHRIQKMVTGSLELQLQMLVSLHMGAGNRSRSL